LDNKTSLTPSVPRQESVQSCTYVLGVSILPLIIGFSDWLFELFRECGISVFHFNDYIRCNKIKTQNTTPSEHCQNTSEKA